MFSNDSSVILERDLIYGLSPNNSILLTSPDLDLPERVETVEQDALFYFILLLGPVLQVIGNSLVHSFIPKSVRTSSQRMFKWRTTFLARITAGITGSWALLALRDSSSLQSDLLLGSSPLATYCLLFSLGVHVAETVDMVMAAQFSFLTIHHIGTIATICGVINTGVGQGFGMFCLIPELNAVFNKTRILHLITDTNKNSAEWRINSVINIVTFFIRVLLTSYVQGHSFQHFVETPNTFFLVTFLSLSFINFWNLSCFKTLVVKDLLRKPKKV